MLCQIVSLWITYAVLDHIFPIIANIVRNVVCHHCYEIKKINTSAGRDVWRKFSDLETESKNKTKSNLISI